MGTLHHNEISFPLPRGWEDATRIVALGPQRAGFRANLTVGEEPWKAGDTLEAGARKSVEEAKKSGVFTVVDERAETLGAFQGRMIEYRFAMNELKLAQIQFRTVVHSRLYVLTYTDLEAAWSSGRAEALQVMSRVTIGRAGEAFEE